LIGRLHPFRKLEQTVVCFTSPGLDAQRRVVLLNYELSQGKGPRGNFECQYSLNGFFSIFRVFFHGVYPVDQYYAFWKGFHPRIQCI
jgi:hypothetical protein